MSDANNIREVSIPFAVTQGTAADAKTYYGSMTAKVGLFKAIFKDGADMAAGCAGGLVQRSKKGHSRTRVIGGATKQIPATTYVEMVYPRKNVSIGKGGEEYRILIEGSWWKFRVSGRQQDFHDFLCSNKENLLLDVYYKTQSGASRFVNRKESE